MVLKNMYNFVVTVATEIFLQKFRKIKKIHWAQTKLKTQFDLN